MTTFALAMMSGLSTATHGQRRDHDTARDAVASGQRLSLSAILEQIEASHGGQILEIERDTFRGREVYEIELLDDSGRVIELAVDAVDGRILDTEIDD